jgi:hypothetical protein
MVWYKSWLDTRWRFVIVLVLLLVVACGTVVNFRVAQQIAAALPADAVLGNERLQQEVQESLEMLSTFRGYAWSQWFAGNFVALLTLVAALLGSGNPLVKSGSGALFSLALPVPRRSWIATRAGVGLAELFVLALAPSIAVSALAPIVGEQYVLVDAIVYGLCAFVGASLFFGLAVFFSALFSDVWRPLLLTCGVAVVLAVVGALLPDARGLFPAMAGGGYFYGGSLPWPELLVSALAAAALVYAAAATVARRDF